MGIKYIFVLTLIFIVSMAVFSCAGCEGEFNGAMKGSYYKWIVYGEKPNSVYVEIENIEYGEEETYYYFEYRGFGYPDGVDGVAEISCDEDVLLFFNATNLSLRYFVMYLWWNVQLLREAMTNESLRIEYGIDRIEERTVLFSLAPRRALYLEFGGNKAIVDFGTGVVLMLEYGNIRVRLEDTNVIFPFGIIIGIVLLLLLAIISIKIVRRLKR